MDMSLIAGMPEVIAYIRSQDERIEALKEELDVWVNPKGDVVMNREGMMLYEASQEENEALKAELDDVKEQLNHYQDACEEINTICGCDPCDPAVNSVSDLKQELKRQIFKELEDELEKINQM